MERQLAEEFVTIPARGRVFAVSRRPGLADCAPSGRLRLDAIARWLQDVAYLDIEDAGVAGAAVWVLRRTRIVAAPFPRFAERLRLHTFCSGAGQMWAERRTLIARAGEARPLVQAIALWVHLDPVSGRPTPLTPAELEVYGESVSDWQLQARLRHPRPAGNESSTQWRFRAVDCDLAGHVNNAAYWTVLEEELLRGAEPSSIDAEIEFRSAAQPGKLTVLVGDANGASPAANAPMRWITGPSGECYASIAIH
jgi:acyl-ACP thioesterase